VIFGREHPCGDAQRAVMLQHLGVKF
jgi:hypothetical protein